MYFKVINRFDVEALQQEAEARLLWSDECLTTNDKEVYTKALSGVSEIISILDSAYRADRDAEADLGGFVYLFPSIKDYQVYIEKIKEYHHMTGIIAEFTDILSENERFQIVSETYILSSDYSIVMVYPMKTKKG